MKINLKDILLSYITAFEQAHSQFGDDVNLEFCTYWGNTFKQGQTLAAPDPMVRDIRKDIETVIKIADAKEPLAYQDFECLGNLIKAIGLQVEKYKREKCVKA